MIRKFFLRMIILLLGIFIIPYNASADYGVTTSAKINEENQLYREIKMYSDQHNIKPIDARVDRIWKAIPGYNGLSVDIEASYKKMKASGVFNKNDIVFKEISPNVHLDSLGPYPIYRGNPEKPMVAFLINVAWGNEYISGMLDVLNKHQIKTTFFFDGSWVKKNPDLAKSIKNAGHEIGNHAYSHPNLQQRSEAETVMELKKTNDVIKETLGITPVWFAPPSGSFNQVTIQVANRLNMKTILWTVDTVDWKKPPASEMVRRVVSKVENGTMILMHPTKPTAEGLETMIIEIKAKGYKLGTVSELMSEKRVD